MPVHNDESIEELVEGPDLGAVLRDLADVLPGRGTLAGRVLIQRSHLDATVQCFDVALDRDRKLHGWAPTVGLSSQQLLATVTHCRLDVAVDVRATADLGERATREVR